MFDVLVLTREVEILVLTLEFEVLIQTWEFEYSDMVLMIRIPFEKLKQK